MTSESARVDREEVLRGRVERWFVENRVEEHPVVKRPSWRQVIGLLQAGQVEQLKEVIERRRELIGLMDADPLRYGWEPECWRDARELLKERPELCVLGGNRSTKTEFAGKEVAMDLSTKSNRIWGCFHSSADSSIRLQQPRVYKFLPPEWKRAGKSTTFHVAFSEKNGFAENSFILPNGSRCFFFNYKQDVSVLEGYEFDGWWGDELMPADFLQALRFRVVTRRGRGILTFTPVKGYTPVVGEYVTAARVMEERPSELLPGENVKGVKPGHMPYRMLCVHEKRAVIFFFTEFNRFSPYEELKKEVQNESTGKIKIRAYGYADRVAGNQFPKFGDHNIVKRDKVPAEGTNYLYADFAWGRNWVLVWIRVWEVKGKKRVFVWKEWPDYQTYGEWVVISGSKKDGERGPAQQSLGFGYKDYKKLIRGIERAAGVTVYERRGDPRSGKAEAIVAEGGASIMDSMCEDHCEPQCKRHGQTGLASVAAGERGNRRDDDLGPMDFLPASGDNISVGVAEINAWLEYEDSNPIGLENEPMFYVCEDCRQTIDCLRMWTGADGLKGASKDFIDVLRYAATDKIEDVSGVRFGSEGGGSY